MKANTFYRRGGIKTARQFRLQQKKIEIKYLRWDYLRLQKLKNMKKGQKMKVNIDEVVKDLHGEAIRKPGTLLSTWPVERLAKYHEKADVTLDEFKKLAAEASVMVKGKDAAQVATVKFLCIESLCNVSPNENPSGEEKFKAYCLARKITEAKGEVDLTIGEVNEIKVRAGKLFQPAVMGPLWIALEASANKPGELKAVPAEEKCD